MLPIGHLKKLLLGDKFRLPYKADLSNAPKGLTFLNAPYRTFYWAPKGTFLKVLLIGL
jgi:hypothetical protein